MSTRFRLGVDIGGTFTDAVLLLEESGETSIAKVPSTPSDPSVGFLDAVTRILTANAVAPEDVSYLVHGTTVATNSLIEGTTPPAAFVTSAGFRDMLEIARQVRPSLYDVHFTKPPPLVPRNHCFEVRERLDARGNVLEPLDETEVYALADRLLDEEEVVSVAVCLLHAYLNPAHERRVEEILRERCPELLISISSSVCPEIREYFRASTTVINACVRPVVAHYLGGIERRLAEGGFDSGAAGHAIERWCVHVRKRGRETRLYGGVRAGRRGHRGRVCRKWPLGFRDVISFDMGGTTAKVGLVLDGQPKITKEYEVGAQALSGRGQSRGSGYPIRTPVIDLVEIGAGGGSIAWVDPGGILRVGPQSAGADPAPICYGKGGEEPTITDANVVLGRLNPEFFLGGEMGLRVDAARDGVARRSAEPLGMDPVECAHGIVEIANAAMTNALRIITVQRGYDPRDLAIVAFGGAGPLHANRLCEEMNIPLLIIPPSPGTASALGLLVTELKHEFSQTRIMRRGEEDIEKINQQFASMESAGSAVLTRDGLARADITFVRQIETRYAGQSFELAIECVPGRLARADLDAVHEAFHAEHRRTYGHGYPQEPTELVNFRVTAIGRIRKPRLREIESAATPASTARKSTRAVHFRHAGGFLETDIYDRARLGASHGFAGPAVIEEMDATTVIEPGYQVAVDKFGNLLVTPDQPDT